jgi:hypothetical protein
MADTMRSVAVMIASCSLTPSADSWAMRPTSGAGEALSVPMASKRPLLDSALARHVAHADSRASSWVRPFVAPGAERRRRWERRREGMCYI